MGRLFLLFTLVPVVELWLLIQIGQRIGAGATVLLVLVTGAVGAFLAKREGLRVLREWQATLARGQLPEEGLTGAALVLVGGVLLVTPGVLTDVAGLALLVPHSRRWIAARVRRRVERMIARGTIRVQSTGPLDPFGGARRPGEREVQGDATVLKGGERDPEREPRE